MSWIQGHLVLVLLAVYISSVWSQQLNFNLTARPKNDFKPLKRSDYNRAKAMIRWLIDNRKEQGVHTFNAGLIRLLFHDCVGGCDGCVNLEDKANIGLGFYKEPLDYIYKEFVFPMMSRADWYALAGVVAVEYACDLTPCKGRICKPHLTFLWGRGDCDDEKKMNRSIPGSNQNPKTTIRNVFRLTNSEITALMGAHTLGRSHSKSRRWVTGETHFDNQYYKDMLSRAKKWKRVNSTSPEWKERNGDHVMLSSDMFLAFDVANPDCQENPAASCDATDTFNLVTFFAENNDLWLAEFGAAFNVMMINGHFGRLRLVESDTLEMEFKGNPFPNGINHKLFTNPPSRRTSTSKQPPTRKPSTKPKQKAKSSKKGAKKVKKPSRRVNQVSRKKTPRRLSRIKQSQLPTVRRPTASRAPSRTRNNQGPSNSSRRRANVLGRRTAVAQNNRVRAGRRSG